MSQGGLTLRDVFLKDGDLFPGTISPPELEPDADCENREDPPSLVVEENVEEDGGDSCGKAGKRGACGGCAGCADYGDMKYHEKIDRMIEREG